MPVEYSSVLVRFGEIGIKSKQTRRRMTRMLADRIRSALKEYEVPFDKVRNEYGRIFIETTSAEQAAQVTSRVFGVVSTSPVITTSAEIKDILDVGEKLALSKFKKGLSFAVEGRRYGAHEYSSQEVRGLLGERLLEEHPELELTVDLSNPEQSIYLEVRDERTYIFIDTIKGVGGMPTGTQGKVVCTISTGLDSPIAAFKIMKRGTIPVFVYFDNSPHSNERCAEVAIGQAQLLANYIHGFEVKLYIVPHWPDLEEAIDKGPEKMTCIFCKRNMMKMAREIAIIENADAIVTGEIIGEQASQTTANLKVLDEAVSDFPILRPLAGDDKVDIERMAHEIGTYEFAKEGLTCCDLAPKYPALAAKVEDAICAEEKMDQTILQSEIQNARIIILRK
ncbi:MAG: tRNA uracil 4-sulfurtransferase ThiI [Candidatus Thorarchaeota archaeon]